MMLIKVMYDVKPNKNALSFEDLNVATGVEWALIGVLFTLGRDHLSYPLRRYMY